VPRRCPSSRDGVEDKRSPDQYTCGGTVPGESADVSERVKVRMTGASVRREGVGSPEPGWAQRLDMTGMLRTRLSFKCEPYEP